MSGRMFDMPVFVKAEDVTAEEIASLDEALSFLDNWPVHRRGPIYETAYRACQLALKGDYPLERARQSFQSFAKFMRILDETPAQVAAAAIGEGGTRLGRA
jgi:hypothetical protein